MKKKRHKFTHGYKRYHLPEYCKELYKYGDFTKIANINNYTISVMSYTFSSGWATFEIINAIKNFYDGKQGIL